MAIDAKSKLGKKDVDQLNKRHGALLTERSSWDAHWQDISDNLLPRSGRFFSKKQNNGDKRHNNIHDSTGTKSLRILAAGMMSGMTSPARPWFRLTTSQPDLDEAQSVKIWLSDVTRLLQMIFAKSNTYRALHGMYSELGGFGTSASIILPNFDSVIHHHLLTTGEFAISTNYLGAVDTLYREFNMTVSQIVGEYGLDNCSRAVKDSYNRGNYDVWVPVVHAIEPRIDRDIKLRDSRNMPFRSVCFEKGAKTQMILRESGFKRFPGIAPRWDVTGGDIYGNSPGMEALGDIKQLQHEQLRKAQAIDYKVNPPLQMPTSMKTSMVDTLPGGISFVDVTAQGNGIRSAFDVNIDMSHLLADIQDVRERIKGVFYADLFLMLANGVDRQMTATEVAERHEEKLLMLGPVVERLNNEILDPLINMAFEYALEAGIIPPAPPELHGMELNVEFVSVLAQAQRAVATNSVDRLVNNIGVIANFKPDVLDKFDADYWVDAYADMLGTDPQLIVPGDKVALIRQQRQQAAQQQEQMAAIESGANSINKLAGAQTESPSALTNVMNNLQGYS